MAQFSPPVDVIENHHSVYETCDSPSDSSTSEPHDETMHIPSDLVDQSFFQKFNQPLPDDSLYMTPQPEQRDQQQQPQQQQALDRSMFATPESASPMSFLQSLSPSMAPSPQQTNTSPFHSPPQVTSVIQPLQPSSTSMSSAGPSPTFWSGFNNLFGQVANNPFPQAIPTLARNFADYLSTYPQLSSASNAVSAPPAAPSALPLPTNQLKTDASQATQTSLPTDYSEPMQIRVLGVPQTGAKSRVETQIKLCIQLVTDNGDKAQWWSHLRLPENMVAKDKLKQQVTMTSTSNDMRRCATGLDSNNLPIRPEKMLFLSARVICASNPSRKVVTCLGCIQRERKRSQRRKENRVKNENDEDEKSLAREEQKVLLFNCSEIVDFSSGDTILPTRITCYCRHHNERLGFCIYFEMHDHTGRRVAAGISPPIMITDDHKSNKLKTGRKRARVESEALGSQTMLAPSSVPALLQQQQQQQQQQQLLHQQMALPPSTMMDKAQIPQPATSKLPAYGGGELSVAPPTVLRQQQSPQPTLPTERPQMQRLIPSEGPTYGGIEVTVLGRGFRPGLICMFGDVPATDTHYWSPNTLVCILPPAIEAGPVVVTVKGHSMVVDSQDVMVFTYYNENDRALMELALQVVGLKMTGKVEDAREIAMRIVRGGNESQQIGGQAPSGGGQQQPHDGLEQHILKVLQVIEASGTVLPKDVSITNAQKHTLLHLAAMLGFDQLVRHLLELGCNVDAVDRNQCTALHYASWYGHHEVVRILLEEGSADQTILNIHDQDAAALASNSATRHIFVNHSVIDNDNVALIQYLQAEDAETTSSDEIIDAEPVHGHDSMGAYSSDEEDQEREDYSSLSNWVQRTLSHFQQPKPPSTSPHTPTDTSFLQNLKNSMPTKASDFSLKTVVDHLLQLPRPATMIANMSVLLPNELGVTRPQDGLDHIKSNGGSSVVGASSGVGTEEPEQTLAWYMALAYAMGARNGRDASSSSSGSNHMEGSSSRPNRKQHHSSVYTPATPSQSTMVSSSGSSTGMPSASSSFDSFYPRGLETMMERKRGDHTLFTVWVPLLCLALIWLIFQLMTWMNSKPTYKFLM